MADVNTSLNVKEKREIILMLLTKSNFKAAKSKEENIT